MPVESLFEPAVTRAHEASPSCTANQIGALAKQNVHVALPGGGGGAAVTTALTATL